MSSVAEEAGDWKGGDEDDSIYLAFALHISSGAARVGFHHHDFGGDGPAIARIGIGVACAAETTLWVMQVGE